MQRDYLLLAEGSTDEALLPLLDKSFIYSGACDLWRGEFTQRLARESLAESVHRALKDYPCDLVFIRRDADSAGAKVRREEITAAADGVAPVCPVCVVPVQETETWLLVDVLAIRQGVANSHGREPLDLPAITDLERRAGAKELLIDRLKRASGRRGRRLDNFERDIPLVMQRVAEEIAAGAGFERLLRLSAFATLQKDLSDALQERGW